MASPALLSRKSLYHARLQQPPHVLAYDVSLEVYPAAHLQNAEVRVRAGLGQDRDGKRAILDRDDGQADPVHAYTALLHAVTEHRPWRPKLPDLRLALGPNTRHLPNTVHMPLNDVPPEPGVGGHRPLQVDGASLSQSAERGPPERLRH